MAEALAVREDPRLDLVVSTVRQTWHAVWLLGLSSCATSSFEGGVYRDAHTAYRVGTLASTWLPVRIPGANVAFRGDTGGAILANALCEGIKDVPLDVLTNQALQGLERKQELSREVVTLDGRAALRTRLSATLDGVPIELELVVTKKDGCTYDLELAASIEVFTQREPEFWRFVQGFQQLPSAD